MSDEKEEKSSDGPWIHYPGLSSTVIAQLEEARSRTSSINAKDNPIAACTTALCHALGEIRGELAILARPVREKQKRDEIQAKFKDRVEELLSNPGKGASESLFQNRAELVADLPSKPEEPRRAVKFTTSESGQCSPNCGSDGGRSSERGAMLFTGCEHYVISCVWCDQAVQEWASIRQIGGRVLVCRECLRDAMSLFGPV